MKRFLHKIILSDKTIKFEKIKTNHRSGRVVHTCNPTTWKAEAGKSSQIRDQPGLHSNTLAQKDKNDNNNDLEIRKKKFLLIS